MVTTIVNTAIGANGAGVVTIFDIRCKSTDTKPVEGITNGSTCIEVDSGKVYVFDEDAGEWNEL